METVTTRSTSAKTVDCNPIELRVTDKVRLVFVPTMIDNTENPRSSIKGSFVYQSKGKNDAWTDLNTDSLRTVKSGETYKLQLHSEELTKLGDGLRALYQIKASQGLPQGSQTFVRLEAGLARFLALGEADLKRFLNAHPDDAVNTLLKIVEWLSTDDNASHVMKSLASYQASELPRLTSILSLASLKAIVSQWESNKTNASEEFWQKLLASHSSVLSQIFSNPILVMQQKAYLGGKQVNNKGGKELDFLAQATATGALLLIEIKTPLTPLLGAKYREGAYPLSTDLNGSIAQVVSYRQSLMKNFNSLYAGSTTAPVLAEPRCVLIVGSVENDLNTQELKNSFELLRERIVGVTIITFDELLTRVKTLIALIEEPL
jgi:hypothetical protein